MSHIERAISILSVQAAELEDAIEGGKTSPSRMQLGYIQAAISLLKMVRMMEAQR